MPHWLERIHWGVTIHGAGTNSSGRGGAGFPSGEGEAEGASGMFLTVVTAKGELGDRRGQEGTESSQGMASPPQWLKVGRVSETQSNPSPSFGVFQVLT